MGSADPATVTTVAEVAIIIVRAIIDIIQAAA